MLKTYRPSIELNFVLKEIGFESSETAGRNCEGIDFLTKVGLIIVECDGAKYVDTKASTIDSSVVLNNENLLL